MVDAMVMPLAEKINPDRVRARIARHIRIDPVTGCHEWTGGTDRSGRYGAMKYGERMMRVTRVVWTIEHGHQPGRWEFICHRCDNPPCVNPAHLFLGTATDNARDMAAKGRAARSNLAPADVVAIRHRYASGERRRFIAGDFDISPSEVWRIATGKKFVQVGGPISPHRNTGKWAYRAA